MGKTEQLPDVSGTGRPSGPMPSVTFGDLPAEWKEKVETAVREIQSSDPDPGQPVEVLYEPLPEAEKREVPNFRRGSVIGIGGKPRAGKDVAGDFIMSRFKGAAKTTFSDNIIPEANRVLRELGVVDHTITADNKVVPMYRKLLQEIGLGYRQVDPDVWMDLTMNKARDLARNGASVVLVTGMRPVDYKQVKDRGGELWEVVRPGNDYVANHAVEDQEPEIPADFYIMNEVEGDLTPYEDQVTQNLIGEVRVKEAV